ncbi:MAG: DegT/DnrJ/EryC1/StrS family aminotransferase [Cytophagales bacterium]|nr:DegT/DnrJ/EryC1/StrS family aminotransferase [Cytophagales bacterium]
MMTSLYPSKPSVGAEELAMVQEVFDSSWLGLGSFVGRFESEIEKYIGGGIAVAVNTGTSALHLALESIGVGKGDEVIVPSLTFCASVQAITALGAKPVFCEVSCDDLCIDVEDAASRISPRTKAIVPVHYCGIVSRMDELLALKKIYGVRIVEDAAHAFGSTYKDRPVGSFGDICCFSFDPIKNITCGEGGAIIVHDENHAELIRRKRVLGIDKDGWMRHTGKGRKEYDVTAQGFRYHMSNINAAIGLVQIKKADEFRQKKVELVSQYNRRLSGLNGLALLKWNLSENFPFAYVVRARGGHRDNLKKHLSKRGIHAGLNYIPNHMQSFFKGDSALPVTEQLFKEIITLPLYCELEAEDVGYVINSIEEYFNGCDSEKTILAAKEAVCDEQT